MAVGEKKYGTYSSYPTTHTHILGVRLYYEPHRKNTERSPPFAPRAALGPTFRTGIAPNVLLLGEQEM